VVMYAGELVEGGNSVEVMAHPVHPYTQLLLSAVPDPHRAHALDLAARAQLRAAVLRPQECPHGSDSTPCRTDSPIRHPIGEEHWVRCLLYRPDPSAPATGLTR
jgi:peptide/nickel transport system ATP-binding protein